MDFDASSLLSYLGETLDKPGRAVRGLLSGRPSELANLLPFSDTMGLTDPAQGVSGRGLLENLGAISPKQGEGFDLGDVAGFAAGVATDPLTYAGGWLAKGGVNALRGLKARRAVTAAPAAAEIASLASPVAEAAAPAAAKPIFEPMLPALPKPTYPDFYSRLERAIEEHPGEQFKTPKLLENLKGGRIGKQGSISPEEIEYTQLGQLIEGKPSITKSELLEHLKEKGLKIKTTRLGEGLTPAEKARMEWLRTQTDLRGPHNDEWADLYSKSRGAGAAQYPTASPQGGENYKETLHQLVRNSDNAITPKEMARMREIEATELEAVRGNRPGISPEENTEWQRLYEKSLARPEQFTPEHFSNYPDLLAHMRSKEYTLPSGERTLHGFEHQSDMDAMAKKVGYKGLPPNPLKGKEFDLTLKQLLIDGAKGGFDRVSWSPGEEVQAFTQGKLSGQIGHYGSSLPNEEIGRRVREEIRNYSGKRLENLSSSQKALIKGEMSPEAYGAQLNKNPEMVARANKILKQLGHKGEVEAPIVGMPRELPLPGKVRDQLIETILEAKNAGTIKYPPGKNLNDLYALAHAQAFEGKPVDWTKYGLDSQAMRAMSNPANKSFENNIYSIKITPELRAKILKGLPLLATPPVAAASMFGGGDNA